MTFPCYLLHYKNLILIIISAYHIAFFVLGILKKISTYSSSSDSEGEETKPAEHPVKQIKTEDGETKATGNGML